MPRGASVTAEAVCFFRALEALRPAPRRVLHDPFARLFLRRSWRSALERPLVAGVLTSGSSLTDFAAMGLQRMVAARHRFIDDALVAFLLSGGEQVVVLGAGFDARALRFATLLGERRIIEVDFPATQERKRRRLERAVAHGHLSEDQVAHIAWSPIDFEHQTLEQGLLAGVFRPGLRTFFAWEGVSMYLTPETVVATLATLARVSAPGSELALDLWSPPESRHPVAILRRSGARFLALLGEPLRFSLGPDATPQFFATHGFSVGSLLDGRGLARRYGLAPRAIFPDISVAHLALR